MLKPFPFAALGLLLLCPLLGCSSSSTDSQKSGGAEKPVASAGDPTEEADKIFVSRCATCHGMEGKGDGPGSVNLNPKPRNYTDKKWQASVKDEDIEKTIVYGGAAVGKSPNMPANPDLNDKPEVVTALRKRIRNFAK